MWGRLFGEARTGGVRYGIPGVCGDDMTPSNPLAR